ncbi:hypothetical protein [Burkholderia stabilis]|uniref:Uncharacterized protein n=1 Tax=Burkholderia stabilis TaxID=95485 RepID=A0A1Y1BSA1_9BURK|nr:hypothetical protein [Burkholderia stabilis]BAX61149.1 hypothetical protein BSFP_040160 [Burkholderia stabilis]
MALYGISGFAILLFFALALTVPLTLIVAAFGLLRSVRTHKAWRRSVFALGCLVFMQVFMLFNNRSIADSYDHAMTAWYTHRLTQATVFDGMTFPPGSTVVLDVHSPHSVESGTVPSNTPLLGLTVSGDFRIFRSDDNTSYVAEGTLAKPASFDGIECAPGPFTRYKKHSGFDYEKFLDTVECTLASEFRYRELDLPAGTHVKALDADSTRVDSISGELPHPWKIFGIGCGAGAFEFDTFERFTCISAEDQRVGDYELLRGNEIMVAREQDGSLRIFGRH